MMILSHLLYLLLSNKCTRMHIYAIMMDLLIFMLIVLFALSSMHFVKNPHIQSKRTYSLTTHTFLTIGHFVTVYKNDTCTINQAVYYVNQDFLTFPINSCNNLSL